MLQKIGPATRNPDGARSAHTKIDFGTMNRTRRGIVKVVLVIAAICLLAAPTATTSQQAKVYGAEQMGVDCSGNLDSSNALQNAIDAMPDAGTIKFSVGCNVKLGTGITTGGCAITIADRVGVQFVSEVLVGNAGGGQTPRLEWNGNGGTMFCVQHTDHPRYIGLSFVDNGHKIDGFLDFDGDPVRHIGTAGLIEYSTFESTAPNPNYVGVSISRTATNNHENYEIYHSYFSCNGEIVVRANDGVTTAGSSNVSSETAKFLPGDTGARIRITYPGAYLDTTIKTVTDGRHIVLNANVKDTQTNVTIHTGQAYGIGISNGPSQNALQQRFWHISYSNCEYGIYLVGGNADMRHINGGQSDFGIFIGAFTAEQSSIDYYESEGDARGIESDGPLTLITNSRLSNGNQFGDGFWKFGGGMVNIQNSLLAFAPRANQVVIGTKGSSLVTSISNSWNVSLALVGYDRFVTPPVTWINDVFDNNPPRIQLGCFTGSSPCVAVNAQFAHVNGVALQPTVTNFYNDPKVTPVPYAGVPLRTPSSSSTPCVEGTIVPDANFVYVCVATNTWKRAALSTW